MSAKKSWDIQPSQRRRPEAPQPAPQRAVPRAPQEQSQTQRPALRQSQRQAQRSVPRLQRRTTKPEPVSRPKPIRKPPPVPQGRDRETLKERRRRVRRRRIFVTLLVIVLCIGGALGGLWWNGLRIQAIAVTGPDSNSLQSIAAQKLEGTNHFIIPNNSIFFYPQQNIRASILKQYPDIAAVSFSRTSLSTILISSIPREAALTWCGPTYEGKAILATIQVSTASTTSTKNGTSSASSTQDSESPTLPPTPLPTCFNADAQGIIFATVPATSIQGSDSLVVYGPLMGDADPASPLGATIAEADMIPNALQLVKIIKSTGVSITTLVLRGDEADLYAQSGTRITYVLGKEEQTAQVVEAAFSHLDVNDGSLEYVDLRFAGKAYYKKVGASTASSTSSQ